MGSAAAGREDKKVEKYSNLSDYYHFVPMGIDTYGAYGLQGIKLVKQIGKNFRTLQVKNYLSFSYFKVYQWQYNKVMQFVLWVAQKINLNFQVHDAEVLWSKKIYIYLCLISFS